MSEIQTWEWPCEVLVALEELHRIMIPNPHPNRAIRIEDLVMNDEPLPLELES